MVSPNKGLGKFHGVTILLLLPLLLIPASLFGGESDRKEEQKSEHEADYDLTVKDDLISLNAKNASLKEIIEEIGSSMKIDVIGNIPEEEKISVGFDKLSLKEALEKLSSNYGYLMDSEKGEKEDHSNKLQITKIIILPKGEETATPSLKTKQVAIKETKISETQEAKESEIKERESKERLSKETKQPEPFKFEFDPSQFLKKGK
jgi:hypothetical protein